MVKSNNGRELYIFPVDVMTVIPKGRKL